VGALVEGVEGAGGGEEVHRAAARTVTSIPLIPGISLQWHSSRMARTRSLIGASYRHSTARALRGRAHWWQLPQSGQLHPPVQVTSQTLQVCSVLQRAESFDLLLALPELQNGLRKEVTFRWKRPH